MNSDRNSAFSEQIFGSTGEISNQTYMSNSNGPIIPNASGTLKLYAAREDSSDNLVGAKILEDGVAIDQTFTLYGRKDKPSIPAIEIPVKANSKYTFTRANDSVISMAIFKAVLTPNEPEAIGINGKVTAVKKYTHKIYDSALHVDVSNSDKTNYPNVTFSGDGVSENEKTVASALTQAPTVEITNARGEKQTVDVKADGSYSSKLEPGTYTIKVTANGGKAEESNVEVSDAAVEKNFTVTEPQYKVSFVTNIKDYKKAYPVVQDNAGNDLFTLDDVTYHEDSKDGTIARAASTTHIVYMPKGSYKYNYTNDRYGLSNQNADEIPEGNISFTVSGDTVEKLYFIPKLAGADKTYITNTVDEANLDGKVVHKGKYTFDYGSSSGESDVKQAGVTYDNSDTEGANTDIYAVGVKDSSSKYGISKEKGAVIFILDKPYLANISTSKQSCALYNVTGGKTINNNKRSVVAIDSGYKDLTVSLAAGTYALVSTVNTEGSFAEVNYIEFFTKSPFEVLADGVQNIDDGSNDGIEYKNARMIIGSYDYTNDSLAGNTSLEDYDKFAIFVSDDADALSLEAVNGLNSYEQYNSGEANRSAKSSASDGNHTPTVLDMNVGVLLSGDYTPHNVTRDETTSVFKNVLGTDDKEIKSDDGKHYFYAVIANNLSTGSYYAKGGAYQNGTWYVQDEAVTIEIE